MNLLEIIRNRHKEASIVVLKALELLRHWWGHPESPYIYIDALYVGLDPTTDDPDGRQKNFINPVNLCDYQKFS